MLKKPKRKILGLIMLFAIVIICILQNMSFAITELHDDQQKPYNILIIHSYSETYVWTKELQSGFLKVLNESDISANLYVEYMDTKHFNSPEYFSKLSSFMAFKYKNKSFDAIAVADDNAMRFALTNRESLFPDVPMFFSGINFEHAYDLESQMKIYGLIEDISLVENIEIIKKLIPGMKQMVFIFDKSETGNFSANRIREEMGRSDIDIPFRIIQKDTLNEVKHEVSQIIDEDTVIVFGFFITEIGDIYHEPRESAQTIVNSVEFPVFGLWDIHMDSGMIGGRMVSAYWQGDGMAKLLKAYLRGEITDTRKIVRTQEHNKLIFDYLAVDAFGINVKELPVGSQIINKPVTFIERNWNVLMVGFGIIALLVIYISLLRLQINSKSRIIRKTERRLIESERQASLARLVSGVAHEINTPLGIIVSTGSYVEQITEELNHQIKTIKPHDCDQIEILIDNANSATKLMMRGVNRIVDLVETFKGIGNLSRDESVSEPTFINQQIDEIIHEVLISKVEARIEVQIIDNESLKTSIDKRLLYEIFAPLIINVIEHAYMQQGGQIIIKIESAKDILRIRFSDYGVGMPEETSQKAFEPFFSTVKSGTHAGLGLYRVHNAVAALGGSIQCNSVVSQGTEYLIELPLTVGQQLRI